MAQTGNSEYRNTQIIRKDGKGVFVESKLDCFGINKAHFEFASYDLQKPQGSRFISHVHIYLDIPEFLQLTNEISSGRLHKRMQQLKVLINKKNVTEEEKKKAWTPLYQCMGGTAAEKLKEARPDGMSLSRTMKILVAGRMDYYMNAESGPGETNEKGLIVPRYGNKPENKVSVALTWQDLEQIFLTTKVHYEAWLSAQYSAHINK